jgi:hypothetical protein
LIHPHDTRKPLTAKGISLNSAGQHPQKAEERDVSSGGSVERLHADLDDLLAVDVVGLPDQTLRDELLDLLAAENRLHAAITERVASFDTRNLADGDACRSTAVWLGVFGRRSQPAASGLVKPSQEVGVKSGSPMRG